jgi:hypothetical protein
MLPATTSSSSLAELYFSSHALFDRVEVTWPGGKKAQVRVPAAARGMRISADGRTEEEKW